MRITKKAEPLNITKDPIENLDSNLGYVLHTKAGQQKKRLNRKLELRKKAVPLN